MSKQKIQSATGVTTAMVDNNERAFTLVAVLEEARIRDVKKTANTVRSGSKIITSLTQELVDYTQYKLSIGLAVVSPNDADVAEPNAGLEIAKGKALKEKSALSIEISRTKNFFTKQYIADKLASIAANVTANPHKYIRISAPKETLLAPLVKRINERQKAKAKGPLVENTNAAKEAEVVTV